jgi:hypothetical protein
LSTRRLATSVVCSNHSNMSSDLYFMLGISLLLWLLCCSRPRRLSSAERGRAVPSPLLPKATRRLDTSAVCSNHSNVPSDRSFYVPVCSYRCTCCCRVSQGYEVKPVVHIPKATRSLLSFQYAQIIPICPLTFPLCSGILLLLWLFVFTAAE